MRTPISRRHWFARNKLLTGMIALVLVAGVSCAGPDTSRGDAGETTASDSPTGIPTDDTELPTSAEGPSVGDTVKVASFGVTVTKVESGIASLGDAPANGQFVKIYLSVTNNGQSALEFPTSQTIYDMQGGLHTPSADESLYVDEVMLRADKIDPGATIDGVLIYDIPATGTATMIELTDNPEPSVRVRVPLYQVVS